MKSKIYKNLVGAVGSLCLFGTMILHWDGICLFFFGEYPFPEEYQEKRCHKSLKRVFVTPFLQLLRLSILQYNAY